MANFLYIKSFPGGPLSEGKGLWPLHASRLKGLPITLGCISLKHTESKRPVKEHLKK